MSDAIAVCLADPRPHEISAASLVFGIPICILYGFAVTAAEEGLLKISHWLGGHRAMSYHSDLIANGLDTV